MMKNQNEHSDRNEKNPFTLGVKKMFYALKRLFPSYLLCFVPFLVFAEKNDLRLILWKIAVVGTGLLVFHFARKSMFPYIDLHRSFNKAMETDDHVHRLAESIIALAQAILISAMAFAIIFAMAGGI